MNTDNADGFMWPSDTPGRYTLAGDELTCGASIEIMQARSWRPARIEHDGAGYIGIYTDAQGGAVRLCAGLPARRPVVASALQCQV